MTETAAVKIPEWNAELVDAFDAETRQIDTLVQILRRQRDGVAQYSASEIQDSVYSIHRVLPTLDEARKRRRTLLEVLDEHGGAAGEAEPDPRLDLSRERLLAAARGLERELALTRHVLETAIESTDAEIRIRLRPDP